ncbi:MAG: COX15/CtaA family protein [Phycisphaeraceae bacterium]|nr:COX15/CtaA family protein [Phycisphaeraceae bacterium]
MTEQSISPPHSPLPAHSQRSASLLRWLTLALVVATFVLVTSGGLVTSKHAGMAVPDWPTSFGRWLLLPVWLWSDLAVLLEHNHRIKGAIGGLLAIAVVAAAWRYRAPIRGLAVAVLVMYIVQGLMGGFRVTENSTTLAVVHGVFGQVVLGGCVLMAVLASPWWRRFERHAPEHRKAEPAGTVRSGRLSPLTFKLAVVFLTLLVVQLTLGAVTRHNHGASAIPDAPAVYGGIIPPLDPNIRIDRFQELGGTEFQVPFGTPILPMEAIETGQRPDLLAQWTFLPASPPTASILWTHYAHRVMAMLVLPVILVWLLIRLRREPGFAPSVAEAGQRAVSGLRGPAVAMILMFLGQVLLGFSIIWSRKEPYIATGHQALGAAILGVSVLLAARCYRLATASPMPDTIQAQSSSPPAATPQGLSPRVV